MFLEPGARLVRSFRLGYRLRYFSLQICGKQCRLEIGHFFFLIPKEPIIFAKVASCRRRTSKWRFIMEALAMFKVVAFMELPFKILIRYAMLPSYAPSLL